jgi:hypothetical protein
MVDDYDPPVGEGLDRMTDIARHDRNQACSGDLGHAVDGHLKLALDHLVDDGYQAWSSTSRSRLQQILVR